MNAPVELFVDRGCPYAHRVLALVAHLGLEARMVEGPVGGEVPGLACHSPSGRVPLLVDGPLVIGESRVMLEHLAERQAMVRALPGDLQARTRHRHAMAVFDAHLASRLIHDSPLPDRRLVEVVSVLEEAAAGASPESLLAFHLAPFWVRFRTWRPAGAITRSIASRPSLAAWLDVSSALPAVASTFVAPDPEIERALRGGQLRTS